MGRNTNEVVKEHKIAISVFVLSFFGAIGLGIIVLQGLLQESWYTDLAICALGATAYTSFVEALRGKG